MFVSNLSSKEITEFCDNYASSLGNVINVYGDPRRQFAAAVVEGLLCPLRLTESSLATTRQT